MNHGSLFSGIGGFDLAAEWMGWENVFHCEWNPFGQKVLKYYWPNATSYEDITKTDFTIWRGKIDILTGGFPCQGFSLAGARKGTSDDRYLWPEYLRAIREIKPVAVVGENVTGILSMEEREVFAKVESRNVVRYLDYDNYEAVYTRQTNMLVPIIIQDLEKEGYKVQVFAIPAASVGAPHKRERIWFVAYSGGNGHQSRQFGKDRQAEGKIKGIKEERERVWYDGWGNGKQGDVTHTNGFGLQETWSGKPTTRITGGCSQGDVTNSPIQGPQERVKTGRREDSAENRSGMDNRPERSCKLGHVTDTKNIGLQRKCVTEKIKRERQERNKQFTGLYNNENWQDFPTQSPVCCRDDGLSSRLDGITFPKWRQESIKAYGNAIVPQVAYQIFKSINEYERNNNRNRSGHR